jgi:hypothetical protein
MKIIYFTPIPETKKLATIITDKSVEDLVNDGVIPEKSKTVIKDYDESNSELISEIYHIELLKFDKETNPTNVVLNSSLTELALIEDIRTKRLEIFAELDSIQLRAMIAGKQNIVDQIEADKVILRNLPSTIDLSKLATTEDIFRLAPIELFIDYKAKYEPLLK